jgi:Trk-type K+ transport system membrane component
MSTVDTANHKLAIQSMTMRSLQSLPLRLWPEAMSVISTVAMPCAAVSASSTASKLLPHRLLLPN